MAEGPKFYEGWLEKYASSKKWIKYWVVIRGNKLHCFKSQNTAKASQYAGYLGVDAPDAVEVSSMSKGKYEFVLHAMTGAVHFRLPTLEARLAWLQHIREAGNYNQQLVAQQSQRPMGIRFTAPAHPATTAATLPPAYPGTMSQPPPYNPSFQPPPVGVSPSYPSPSTAKRGGGFDPSSPLPPTPAQVPPPYNPAFGPPRQAAPGPSLPPARATHSYEDAEAALPAWHFGRISRARSEELLLKHGSEGYFLIRESESSLGDYTMSVYEEGTVKHYKINQYGSGGMKVCLATDPDVPFDSLHDLIKHTIDASNGRAYPLDRSHVQRMELAFESPATASAASGAQYSAFNPNPNPSYPSDGLLPGQRFALEQPVFQERRRPERQQSTTSAVSVVLTPDEHGEDPDLAHDYEYEECLPEAELQRMAEYRRQQQRDADA